MTTVCYRSGEMAADSSCWIENTCVHPMKKIWRIGGGLVGCAGNVASIDAFIRWLRDGAVDGDYPLMEGLEAIVVDPRGRVHAYDEASSEPIRVRAPYCAIGSGQDFALGALHAGADARGAVRAAIKHHGPVKGPVRVYRLRAGVS